MIIDTSVVVALAFREPTVPWVLAQIEAYPQEILRMSWVNAAEANIALLRAGPRVAYELEPVLDQIGIELLENTHRVIQAVARARLSYPINFGDCFAYAHAQILGEPLLTLDADFLKTDLPRVLHPEA